MPFWPDTVCNQSSGAHVELTAPALSAYITPICGEHGVQGQQLSTKCLEKLGRWRHLLAAPLLHKFGIPLVPLAAALHTLGWLHKGPQFRTTEGVAAGYKLRKQFKDCTHYCDRSQATMFMAQSALNVVWGLLTSR